MTIKWTVRRLKYICCKLNYNIYSRVGNTWVHLYTDFFFYMKLEKNYCVLKCATWHVHTYLLLVITVVNYFSIFRALCKLKETNKQKVLILLLSKNFSQIDASFCCLSRKSLIQIKLCLHLQRGLIKFYNIFIQLHIDEGTSTTYFCLGTIFLHTKIRTHWYKFCDQGCCIRKLKRYVFSIYDS